MVVVSTDNEKRVAPVRGNKSLYDIKWTGLYLLTLTRQQLLIYIILSMESRSDPFTTNLEITPLTK